MVVTVDADQSENWLASKFFVVKSYNLRSLAIQVELGLLLMDYYLDEIPLVLADWKAPQVIVAVWT